MLRLAATVLTLVIASPAVADPYAKLRAEIESRLPDLNAFVRVATGYKATHLPKVVIKDRVGLYQLVYGSRYKDQDKACDVPKMPCIKAAAMNGVIFIGDDFKHGRDDYILVHELTHFQQHESTKAFPCIWAREPEAYQTADKFVELTGRGEKSDGLTVAILSSCDRGM